MQAYNGLIESEIGLNLENPITIKFVDPYTKWCKRRLSLF